MLPSKFLQELGSAPIAPVYLFLGESVLLIEEAWRGLLEKIVPESARAFNGERWAAKDHSMAEVANLLSGMPMFGSKRLLMVRSIEDWPKDQRKALENYLARPNAHACLVLTAAKRKGLESLESAVSAVGKMIHFQGPSEKDAPRWLVDRAKKLGKQLSPQAALLLLERVGLDLLILERELEKLCLYTGERRKIEPDDVAQVSSAQRTFTVFELLRYVGQKQSGKALASLKSLLLAGESPLGVLALLARQIRMVWQVKDGLEQGVSLEALTRTLHLPGFVLRDYARQAAVFSEPRLARIHQIIRETDSALKGSGAPPERLMELLIIDLCRDD
jgi:DNA polymerase-3 subunit delta